MKTYNLIDNYYNTIKEEKEMNIPSKYYWHGLNSKLIYPKTKWI